MSFLAPLFLLGALAVGLPIVFHLIRRSSREQMPFSSLMFLEPTPPRLTKRSRLEHILLLLLRCLIIGLVAFAFARPFFQEPMLASQPPETGRKVVLLIDTSASMRREGLWPAALAKAAEALKQTSPDDRVAVFTFDSKVRPVMSFDQWSAMNPAERVPLTEQRLGELKPGFASTHLGTALIAAAEALAESEKQGENLGPRRIVLISDVQEGSRLDGLQGYEWPRGIDVQVEQIQPRRPTNAGMQWVAEGDNSTQTGPDASTRIRVSNSANAQREQFQIHWDGVAGAVPLDIYVPPGQSRIVPAPKLLPDATGERLVLTGDDDDFDNSISIVQPGTERIPVLFLGDEPETDSSQPLYYLKRAFQQTRLQAVEIKAQPVSTPISPAALTGVRLMLVSDRLPDEQAAAARKFVADGGTILFVMKDARAADTVARVAGIGDLTASEATPANYAMLGLIDFQHPLFAPFADPRYNDFTKIHFWKYRRLDPDKLPGARVLARFDSGDPALLEIPSGKGRLLVLTSGWQPADSQLALSSKFVPLLYGLLELSGATQTRPAQFHIGDSVNLANFAASAIGQPVVIRKPDGTEVHLRADEPTFAQTDLPGIYTIISLQPQTRFAVNLDAAESRTAPLPLEQLERLGVPMQRHEVKVAKNPEKQRRLHDAELESRQKLWRWLTFAALMVLLGETWLASRLTRRTGLKTEAVT